jgi:hypothetical protein
MSKRTVFDLLPESERNNVAHADVRLVGAYKAFVEGKPSSDDCAIILVDLASFSGYYNTTSSDASDRELRQAEGRREVYGRIVRLADMPLAELRQLQEAVLLEQRARGE